MLRERSRLLVRAHRTLDIGITAAAFITAYFIKKYLLPAPFRGLTIAPNYYVILLMIIIIWYLTFNAFDLYDSYRRRAFGEIFMNMAKAVATGTLILILGMYLFKITDVSRVMLGIFFILDIALLGLSKGIVYYILHRFRKKGYNFRNLLIVGSFDRAKDVIDSIYEQQGSGFKVVGCLDLDPDAVGKEVKKGVKLIGTMDDFESLIREEIIDEIIFAMPLKKIKNAGQYITSAEEIGISVRIVPDWQIHSMMLKPGIATASFEDFLGIPTMAIKTTPANEGALVIKTAFDYLLAGAAIIILSPFLILIALAIKLSSRGPVLFTQERSGLNGRRFQVYKFRTMAADAAQRQDELKDLNESDGPVFKIKNDPRIIPYIGTFLRKTGIDEIPQLINILKGEMSLVGPRPPIPDEVDKYDRWQMRRLSMKPGISCLWQVSYNRNDLTFDQWMKMDLEYIDNWSLWLDLKIMMMTVRAVIGLEGR